MTHGSMIKFNKNTCCLKLSIFTILFCKTSHKWFTIIIMLANDDRSREAARQGSNARC